MLCWEGGLVGWVMEGREGEGRWGEVLNCWRGVFVWL